MATGDITIRSAITPEFTFNALTPGLAGSATSPFASFLQPSLDIDLDPFGTQHIAPYGEPPAYGWVIGLAILLGIVFIFYKILSK